MNTSGGGYDGEPSLFDEIRKDDLIMAFFPCTRFECRVPLMARTEAFQHQNWDDETRLEYSRKIVSEIDYMYEHLCKMIILCLRKGLRMIIENPYTKPQFLTEYFPIKPKWIDQDRRDRGDLYKKPTQFFFINCEPKHNFIWEAQEYIPTTKRVEKVVGENGIKREVIRSQITSAYANRFIREFILEGE